MIARLSASRLSGTSCYICASCIRNVHVLELPLGGLLVPKRSITQGWLRKTAEAKVAWDAQAKEIQAGQKQGMLSVLEERGYVNAIAGNRNDLEKLMNRKRIGAYLGLDPTAPSMHVGHLLPLMSLFWMYVNGFHAVTLVSSASIPFLGSEA